MSGKQLAFVMAQSTLECWLGAFISFRYCPYGQIRDSIKFSERSSKSSEFSLGKSRTSSEQQVSTTVQNIVTQNDLSV
jgi:hypothetical protein